MWGTLQSDSFSPVLRGVHTSSRSAALAAGLLLPRLPREHLHALVTLSWCLLLACAVSTRRTYKGSKKWKDAYANARTSFCLSRCPAKQTLRWTPSWAKSGYFRMVEGSVHEDDDTSVSSIPYNKKTKTDKLIGHTSNQGGTVNISVTNRQKNQKTWGMWSTHLS